LWPNIVRHPFVAAAADGSLDHPAFDRWLVEDHAFVVGFRSFVEGLAVLAPNDDATAVLAGAQVPLAAELELFAEEAERRGLDLDADPGPTTLGYTSFIRASLQDGYDVALTVLYGAEKAYYDAWRAVRDADEASPYRRFIENWSSDAFGFWVDAIATLLDAAAPDGPTIHMRQAFGRVVRFEIRFWDAVLAGERW
jgi:thiaminase/transcriptional activator TenA